MEILSKSLAETEAFAREFVSKLKTLSDKATIVALSGNLGSGKTTFTQAVGKILGIKEKITSPTFVIMKKFSILDSQFSNLFHIDAYRLESGDELLKLRFAELLADPKNLIFIEWPENVVAAVPKDAIKIGFEFVDDKTRKIQSF